ncbi:RagB/SusD family nutrient uptake outer membrane protein [Flexithrix dorotheae]|uniref:RagB/SusD family nutrient uptake outer membrane protein n=1 Tax=Flexithrix dorotheae TaxID=70993 RepID=UPI00146F8B6D|nr:RagB/SusD family nutrient uptake outer membrane protein [Flexithrix dorotheae]
MKFIKSMIATSALIFLYASCSQNRLDVTPLSETEQDYYKEELHFVAAIGATYAKLGDFYWYNANNPQHQFYLLPGDDVTTDGGYPFEVFSTVEAGAGELGYHYRSSYLLISRANTLLQKLDDEELTKVITTPNLKEQLRGEALFLRGHTYMYLWNYFGTAPLIDERISSQEGITPPSSEGTQLLDQAIADFEEAAGLLPESWPVSDNGRVTKNAANGMLGKSLVIRGSWNNSQEDYSKAITAFSKINGPELVANFADNFNAATENNKESLFEYQSGNAGDDNVWLDNDDFESVGSFSAYWGFFNSHWSFWAGTPFLATEKLANTFEDGDPRTVLTVNKEDMKFQKYWTLDQMANTGVGSLNNPRILRYADVLLLWAEALNETGNQAGAVEKINEVRTRARNMDTTGVPANRPTGSQGEVRSWIQEERFLELAGEEGHRWVDLRRWHKAGHIDLSTFDFSSRKENFSINLPKNLYYPIPISETDKNPNVKQNPGY